MYNYIIGKVTSVTSSYITIENNGIGYLLIVPNPFQFEEKTEKKVFTHHYVREDNITLYGFLSLLERDMFVKLINVKGLGPKGALAILASSTVNEIADAVNNADAKFFTRFPGIGSKSSQQIVLDLKGKIDLSSLDETKGKATKELDEVSLALKALGYNNSEIKSALKQIEYTSDTPLSELVKMALRKMQ